MDKIDTPVISVIMPMRNAEDYVAEAINSILSQSYRNLELIIIDDQSTDQSRNIVENILQNDSRIKLINGGGQGAAVAENLGLQHVKGHYVMFCDADDVFADNCIENQFDWLNKHQDIGAVCARFAMMDSKGRNKVNLNTGESPCDITEELLSGKTRTHLCTFIIRRKIIEMTGGFRDFFVSAYDIDFQLRLAEVCKVFYKSELVYFYRLHNSSIVHTQTASKKDFFEATARLFHQQRKQNGIDDLQLGNPPQIPVEYGLSVDARIQLQGALIGTAWQLHQEGQKLKAFKTGLKACRVKPDNLRIWKSFVMLFLK